VTDSSLALVPEFDEEARAEIVVPHTRPSHFTAYTSVDPGSRDRTGFVFAYVDFLNGKVVVTDEELLPNPTTRQIAATIKAKEASAFGEHHDVTRVSDIDLRLITDLRADHGLQVQKAVKVDMLASVNQLRHFVQTRKIIIDPRCVNLVHQLQTCIWDKRGTDMAREGSSPLAGHFDLIAALRYLLRAVDWSKNPYPAGFYERGGRFGPGVDQFVSPKALRNKKKLTLADDTPMGRKLHGKKQKPRR
jgi:hypothetical protein